MADSTDKVTFNPRPIGLGLAWGLVATHALSGQQEHIVGFHTETEAKVMARKQRVQGVAQNKRLCKTDHHFRHVWKISNATMANATSI